MKVSSFNSDASQETYTSSLSPAISGPFSVLGTEHDSLVLVLYQMVVTFGSKFHIFQKVL